MMVMAMVILKMGSSYTIAILSICVVLDSSVAPSRGAEAPGGFGGRLRVRARPLLPGLVEHVLPHFPALGELLDCCYEELMSLSYHCGVM